MEVLTQYYQDAKQMCSQPRQVVQQALNLGCVVFSALMLWKLLMLCTGSQSPVVVVLSGSMEPGFQRGDILFLTKPQSIHSGDVVVFQVDGREIPIVHRAMNIHVDLDQNFSLLTKGDNNMVDDRGLYAKNQLWLENSHILGTATGFLPYVGMVTIWLNDNPLLKFILIGTMGILVMLVFAIKGKDFVLVAADAYSAYSIIRLSNKDDKIKEIDGDKLLAIAGPIADRHQFGEYISRNIHLHRIRHGVPLSTHAAATFSRTELATYLRKNPYQVNMLLAGSDKTGPRLYWIDFLASMVEIEKAAHGYASNFLLGLLDRYYTPDLTEEDALDICKKCIEELKIRFLISQSEFIVKIVNKDGIRIISI